MERILMDKLVKWKNSRARKPLILQGVRQCGKTYLLKEFGARFYADVFYLKFDDDASLSAFFEQDLNPRRIIKDLSVLRGKAVDPRNTLIIFDEIQSCGKALTALKYFYEDAPEYHIAAAGSLLGVAVSEKTSFPVGKVEFMTLYPMNFFEFLTANNAALAERLSSAAFGEPPFAYAPFIPRLSEYYRDFLIVGGMPEAAQYWLDTHDIEGIRKIQKQIITGYENDFAKYAPPAYFPKLSAVWNAIPSQLAKENRKFIFSQVKKSWRAKDLEDALEWLIRAGLVYKVENIETPGLPLAAYASHTFFKLYMCDVGLLLAASNMPASVIFDNTDSYAHFKGAVAENYICRELMNIYEERLFYWTAEGSGRAEIDFIIQDGADIVPVEVKAGKASRARSLGVYRDKYAPAKSVLTSMDGSKENILPLYMFWDLKKWLKGG